MVAFGEIVEENQVSFRRRKLPGGGPLERRLLLSVPVQAPVGEIATVSSSLEGAERLKPLAIFIVYTVAASEGAKENK
jgi:hypothetical protein